MIAADGTAVYPWNHGETLTAAALNAAVSQFSAGGPFLPLTGGTVNPGPLTVSNSAVYATGATINPVGQYEAPPVAPASSRANFGSYVNTAVNGGHYTDATLNSGSFITNIYGAPNFNCFDLVGIIDYAGTGGTGQHVALTGNATRNAAAAQPTTTVSATLSAPNNVISVTDVTNLQVPYPMPIMVNGHSYIQTAVSGASGPGTITLSTFAPVADGTSGNIVQGCNNPGIWAANIIARDTTGLPSSKTNALIGIELDIGATGADDAGQRSALTIVGGTATLGQAVDFATGIFLIAGDNNTTFDTCIRISTPYSRAVLDTRLATQGGAANAIWLADGQFMAWNTAGTGRSYWDAGAFSGAGGIHHTSNVEVDGTLYAPNGLTVGGTAYFSGTVPASPGITGLFAAPPAIGGTTPAAATFTGVTTTTGGVTTTTGGLGCGSNVGASATDLSHHLRLYGNTDGINVTPGQLNIVTGSTAVVAINTSGINTTIGATSPAVGTFAEVIINASGPNIRAGTGVATGTQPAGSLFLRTDGTAGARLYVSAGGGTWAAVAGV